MSKPFKRVDKNIYKRGGSYYIVLWHYNRLHRESAGNTLTAARNLLAKRKSEFNEGDLRALNRNKFRVTFDEVAIKVREYWNENLRAPDRPAITLEHASKVFGEKYLKDITSWDIERYKRKRKKDKWQGKPISPTTIRKELAHLNRVFRLAGDWGLAPPGHNPVKKVKKPKESKGRRPKLTLEEEKKLLAALPANVRPVVKFLIYTGCRRGEVLGLTWERVDMEKGTIYLDRTKSGEPRTVPLCATALEILDSIPHREGYVFVNRKGKPYKCIRASFDRAKNKVGLHGLRTHDLRHVFASRLREMGVSLDDIGEVIGDKTLRMTMRYAHLELDTAKGFVGLLDGLGEKPSLHRSLHTPKGSSKVVPLNH